MLRAYRFALAPRWFVLHLVTVALVVTMVLLGRWQLTVSERKHFDLQNFGYAFQWWAFSAFVLVMWARVLRDARRKGPQATTAPAGAEPEPTPQAPVAYRRYVMPQRSNASESVDPERAAYNEYLAGLAARDKRKDDGKRAS